MSLGKKVGSPTVWELEEDQRLSNWACVGPKMASIGQGISGACKIYVAWEISTELSFQPQALKFYRDVVRTQPKVWINFHKILPLHQAQKVLQQEVRN